MYGIKKIEGTMVYMQLMANEKHKESFKIVVYIDITLIYNRHVGVCKVRLQIMAGNKMKKKEKIGAKLKRNASQSITRDNSFEILVELS